MNIPNVVAKSASFVREHRIAALFSAALILGLIATWGIRSHVSEFLASEREKLVPKVKTVEVVVAKRSLKAGEAIGPETMAVRAIPEQYVSSSAILPNRFDGYLGAKLKQDLQAGEALVASAIAGADIASFSSKVKLGIRALTVSVDEVNSVSGMLQPGDRIDLLVSVRPPPSGVFGAATPPAPEITAPLVQDILVLATGKQVRPGHGEEGGQRGFNAITVEVSPEQAQKLVVAQRGGKLTAMLRNPGDHLDLPKQAMDLYALLGIKPQTIALPPMPMLPSPIAMPKPIALVPPLDLPVLVAAPIPQGPEIIVGGRGPLGRNAYGASVPVGGASGVISSTASSAVTSASNGSDVEKPSPSIAVDEKPQAAAISPISQAR